MHPFFLQMHDLEVVSNVYFTHRLHGWMDGWMVEFCSYENAGGDATD